MERYMKKRKVTAVLLAAMMCMQIFAGCGTKNDAAQTESSEAATEDAQGAAGENTQTAGQNDTEENAGGMAEIHRCLHQLHRQPAKQRNG